MIARCFRGLVALLACLLLVACSGTEQRAADPGRLDLISWWTSGSEQAALNVLLEAYRRDHPGVEVENGAVAGGSGSNAQVVLASRLQRNDPPDAWQTFPGAGLRTLKESGKVADVSEVYARTGLTDRLPPAVRDAVTVDGAQYAVPASAHRQNVLWFNKDVLAKAGVAEPGPDYSLDAFTEDLATVQRSGATPLCLGGKDRFTRVELFENVLLATVGNDGWDAIAADRFDWGGDQAHGALTAYGRLLDAADPEADALTWDGAAQKLAAGGCAFQSMNDSSYGEYRKAGASEATMGAVAFPGTADSYLAVLDSFVVGAEAQQAQNGQDFLATIADPATQVAFSVEKGSIPVRTDAELSSLQPYQQRAAQAYREGTITMSIAHGELLPPSFQAGFYDAVAGYSHRRDAGAFTNTLIRSVVPGRPGGI